VFSSCYDGWPFRHNRHAPFWGRELGPHLTQCGLGRDLPAYQVASWSIHPFGHNRHGPKIGGCTCFFFGGGRVAESPSNTMCLGRGLPPYQVASWSIQPFGHNTPSSQTDRTDRQTTVRQHRANVLQTVAQTIGYISPISPEDPPSWTDVECAPNLAQL